MPKQTVVVKSYRIGSYSSRAQLVRSPFPITIIFYSTNKTNKPIKIIRYRECWVAEAADLTNVYPTLAIHVIQLLNVRIFPLKSLIFNIR